MTLLATDTMLADPASTIAGRNAATPKSSRDALLALARTLRVALEPGLARDHAGAAISRGSCLYAALLVVITVHRFGLGIAAVRGGSGAVHGASDPRGRWHGHYWSEVIVDDGAAFIVDITADQFGWAPVVVIPSTHAASRYRPGDQADVDDALLEGRPGIGGKTADHA